MSFGAIGQPAPYTGPTAPTDKLASRIMESKDFAVLHRRTTELGSFIGFSSGAAFTYGLHRLSRNISRNALFLIFFTSATASSWVSTHYLLTHRIADIRKRLGPQASDGEPHLLDPAAKLDPDLTNWTKEFETGSGGMRNLEDRYNTTSGTH